MSRDNTPNLEFDLVGLDMFAEEAPASFTAFPSWQPTSPSKQPSLTTFKLRPTRGSSLANSSWCPRTRSPGKRIAITPPHRTNRVQTM